MDWEHYACVYVIRSPNIDKVYIGSTRRNVLTRFKNHLQSARRRDSSSSVIIMAGDSYVEELECIPRPYSRRYLREREQHWLDFFAGDIVNINRAIS